MHSTRARRGETHAKSPGVLGVAARGERRRFLVADLDEANVILVAAQCFENAVHAIAGKAKNCVHVPGNETFDKEVCDVFRHRGLSLSRPLECSTAFRRQHVGDHRPPLLVSTVRASRHSQILKTVLSVGSVSRHCEMSFL